MNFDMAAEMASFEDIEVRTVLVKDDVASAPPAEAGRRRGVAGMVFAFKCAGAKADMGGSLDAVAAAAEKALAHTRTMGVALSPCTVPRAGKPTFTIGEGEMEIGMGIHGEPGMKRESAANGRRDHRTRDDGHSRRLATGRGRQAGGDGQRLGRHAAGGACTSSTARRTRLLAARGIGVHRAYVGEYATSMEMAGASITLMRVDDELAALLDHPAHTPFFVQV
jgi:dihydroxyacetone kinase-like protein